MMELVAPAGPVYQAGTLSGNPVAMTAGLWALKRLTPKLYKDLARRGAMLAAGSPTPRATPASPLQVNAFGSLVTPFFTSHAGARLRLGAQAPTRRPTRRSSAACWRAASTRRRRSSRRGSCRPRTLIGM